MALGRAVWRETLVRGAVLERPSEPNPVGEYGRAPRDAAELAREPLELARARALRHGAVWHHPGRPGAAAQPRPAQHESESAQRHAAASLLHRSRDAAPLRQPTERLDPARAGLTQPDELRAGLESEHSSRFSHQPHQPVLVPATRAADCLRQLVVWREGPAIGLRRTSSAASSRAATASATASAIVAL